MDNVDDIVAGIPMNALADQLDVDGGMGGGTQSSGAGPVLDMLGGLLGAGRR
jgi:hypothetical protein